MLFKSKQYLLTKLIIHKIIGLIKKSSITASNIGTEFSLYYFYSYNDRFIEPNIKLVKNGIYYLINHLNSNYNLNFSNKKINFIDNMVFIQKFHKKLFKLKKTYIFSFLRGYYINNLHLYSTNINNLNNNNNYYYFALYDFHNIYLNYLYNYIFENVKYYPKIKYLTNTNADKYSINELTDNIPFKIIFLHKKKYVNNIIKFIFHNLFYDEFSVEEFNEEQLYVYNLLNNFN